MGAKPVSKGKLTGRPAASLMPRDMREKMVQSAKMQGKSRVIAGC